MVMTIGDRDCHTLFKPLARIHSVGLYVFWFESVDQMTKLDIRRVARIGKGDATRQISFICAVSSQHGSLQSYLGLGLNDQVSQEIDECTFVICAGCEQFHAYLNFRTACKRLER